MDWGPDYINIFDWECDADSICHEVTTPDLDLVFVNQWIMTVTYRYPVAYDPAYVDYSTDHGRTWAALYQFSQQDDWTTIDLDLSQFSGADAEPCIMFQIHNAFGAPYYLDISRVKIWAPQLKAHPEKFYITLDDLPEGESDSTFFNLEGLVNGQTYRAGVQAEYSTGVTDTLFTEFTFHELFPPENFSWTEEGYFLKFSWTEPSGSWNAGKESGEYPDALKGYVLTYTSLNPTLRFEIDDPSQTFFSFEKPNCDSATATLTAVYDLSEYGYPGTLFESNSAAPLQITFGGPYENDFFEDWSVISFAHNCWKTSGNGLAIEAGQGIPGPALVFVNAPEHYESFLTSFPMNIPQHEDAQCYLEFDLNLFAGGQGGYETMEVQVQQEGTTFWDMVQGVSNSQGNLAWHHFTIDLSGFVSTDVFRIRFMFKGIGAEGVQWKVDNIHVHNFCSGPPTLLAELTGENEVTLNWNAVPNARSASTFDSYNIFRKFNDDDLLLLSTTTDTFHYDYLTEGGRYCYQINARYDDAGAVCESQLSDSAWIISTLNISEKNSDGRISIYPNPVNEKLFINSEENILNVYLYNSMGIKILEIIKPGVDFEVEIKGLSPGIYLLQIELIDKKVFRKIVH